MASGLYEYVGHDHLEEGRGTGAALAHPGRGMNRERGLGVLEEYPEVAVPEVD